MMIGRRKVSEVCAAVEELAPPALAYEWDKPGLAMGDPGWDVSHVLVALTVTRQAADAAIKTGAGMIVSHHPLIWDPLQTLRLDNPHAKLCVDLVQARIACYAAHTNLDVAPGGVNDTLAAKLGLEKQSPLLPLPHGRLFKLVTFVPEIHLGAVPEAVSEAGAGAIGHYTECSFSTPGTGTFLPGKDASPFSGHKGRVNEEPERRFEILVHAARLPRAIEALKKTHPYEEVAYDVVHIENRDEAIGLGVRGEIEDEPTLEAFAARVRETLSLSHVRTVGEAKRKVRYAAVMGGAGGGRVGEIPSGIGVFVTGDVGYHDALAAQARGLAVIDAGHEGTERCVIPVLARHLRKRLKGLRVSSHREREIFQVR